MNYIIKKLEIEKNKVLALKNAVNKIRNDSSLWKPVTKGGADQYLGLPPAMRYLDEAIRRVESLEKEWDAYKASLQSINHIDVEIKVTTDSDK